MSALASMFIASKTQVPVEALEDSPRMPSPRSTEPSCCCGEGCDDFTVPAHFQTRVQVVFVVIRDLASD